MPMPSHEKSIELTSTNSFFFGVSDCVKAGKTRRYDLDVFKRRVKKYFKR